jgi:molybdate transport system substrate-binding protein
VLQELASVYEKRTGEHVAINAGASNTLARQIVAGARVDLFISADEAQMNVVREHVVTGTRVDLLSNRLAIAVPDDRPRTFGSARDLLDPSIRRVAMGDPTAVPAGVYARQYLERLGIWSKLQPKIVPTATVRLALAASSAAPPMRRSSMPPTSPPRATPASRSSSRRLRGRASSIPPP